MPAFNDGWFVDGSSQHDVDLGARHAGGCDALAGCLGHPAGAAGAPAAGGGPYIFADEFDGPAGSPPDPGKWTIQTWQDDVFPPVEGIYRDDRQNVFQDGNSNLVLCATHDLMSNTYYSGKLRGNFRSMINQTWEARIKLDCLFPGLWPSFWGVNEDPLPDGEVDIFEWYGNGDWAPAPRSTRRPTGRPGRAGRFPVWSTATGTRGECTGAKRDSSSSGTGRSTTRCPTSPSTSPAARPTTSGGRSTTPATG
ncbi:glycosyl hydrolases family protein 16 [Mycobacterium intracellulare 1956]|uniref:Glycosyl hydrolases family protein 16 n=1 Tax=Mycobacterium intracellulare 1956 TaxID=1299331 RepID=X8CB59_MYCIT|nr:glycosyl hydrolases family protein 16 [Mycobacterium intracellulare 1956]